MAHSASKDSGKDETTFNFSCKIFTSWDYLIGNSETAENKFAFISTHFKEAIDEVQQHNNYDNIHRLRLLRLLANFLVLCAMVGSGYLIYFVVHRSEKFFENGMENHSWWERNEVNIVTSLLNIYCPMLFDVIGQLEHYHPRVALRWQLGRIFVLFLGNIYTFILAVLDQFKFSRDQEEQLKHNLSIWEANMGNFSKPNPADAPRGFCWETMVGQEAIRVLLSDALTLYSVVLVGDFVRAVFVRVFNHCWCWDLEYSFPSYSEFDLSGNVLNLIYSQGMIWMGSFYAPGLPAINLIKLQTSMFLQGWGVKCCNAPNERVYKASSCNRYYMSMLMVILVFFTLPTIFSIVAMPPSFDCGPFSGKKFMYDVITETIHLDLPVWLEQGFGYLLNPGLVLTVILFLMLAVYYLHTTFTTFKEANSELKIKLRSQIVDNRKKTRLIWETTEFLEQAAMNTEIQLNNTSGREGDRCEDRRSCHPSCPVQNYPVGQGSVLKHTRPPAYTRQPAPRSFQMPGQSL